MKKSTNKLTVEMFSLKKLFNFIFLLFLLFNCQINPSLYLSVVAATYNSGPPSLSNDDIVDKINSDGSNVATLSTYPVKFNNNNINTNNNNINNNNDNKINFNFTKYYENNNKLNNYNNNNNNNNNNEINFQSLSDCLADRLVIYKVVLHTYWTRNLFPKHYPDWRPQAQWTKTIGRSHDSSFSLFHIGQRASPGVKQFAESGKTDLLENQRQWEQQQKLKMSSSLSSEVNNDYGIYKNISNTLDTSIQYQSTSFLDNNNHNNNNNNQQSSRSSSEKSKLMKHAENRIFDEFDIPAISTGGGRNEAKFFVDGNHSLVSLMTRIVPSPDWFIGVDSLQLCIGGSWLDTVTVEMDPLDAGTDNGFTFTAPNWPTEPQGVIYRITSRYPAHPAGSFFYPKSKRLPPIATFQFIKLKEYEISEVFNFEEDEHKYELVKTRTHLEVEHNHVEMNNELSASIEKERQNEVKIIPIVNTEKDRVRAKLLEKMNPSLNNTTFDYQSSLSQSFSSPSSSLALNAIAGNDKDALINDIAKNYNYMPYNKYSKLTSKEKSNRKHHKKHFKITLKDCRVSHWSKWSSCSKTCGIGEMHRHRKIIKHGRRGGKPCPPLQESKWCGTARGCHSSPLTLYNWSDT